jgi:hypothetical protein
MELKEGKTPREKRVCDDKLILNGIERLIFFLLTEKN